VFFLSALPLRFFAASAADVFCCFFVSSFLKKTGDAESRSPDRMSPLSAGDQ
jgi:hypothetical protein